MKLGLCVVDNFGSYGRATVDFRHGGLTLVYGPTGAGKSTILDMAFWTLFGVTSKNGNVDEVRSWQCEGAPTIGQLGLEHNNTSYRIVRTRGSAAQNDLFWCEDGSKEEIRGKDIKDTQALLEKKLGLSPELFSLGSYFHEFSPTSSFFVAKAKDRRAIFEKIANLDLAVKLANEASAARRVAKQEATDAEVKWAVAQGQCQQADRSCRSVLECLEDWEANKANTVARLRATMEDFEKIKEAKLDVLRMKYARWENDRQAQLTKHEEKLSRTLAAARKGDLPSRIEQLKKDKLALEQESNCDKCGGPRAATRRKIKATEETIEALQHEYQRAQTAESSAALLATEIASFKQEPNFYEDELIAAGRENNDYADKLAVEEARQNPFTEQMRKAKEELRKAATAEIAAKHASDQAKVKVSDLSQIYDLSFELRGKILEQSVKEISESTNAYLEKYFDSEIRVHLLLDGADSLEVAVQKNGYDCTYRQLSKGQQRLLKLCFAVSVMTAAANRSGIHFDNLFFDEALDGLDTSLKLKAFHLFEQLEKNHATVMVIDHAPELQQLFSNRLRVSLENDYSVIEQENE